MLESLSSKELMIKSNRKTSSNRTIISGNKFG